METKNRRLAKKNSKWKFTRSEFLRFGLITASLIIGFTGIGLAVTNKQLTDKIETEKVNKNTSLITANVSQSAVLKTKLDQTATTLEAEKTENLLQKTETAKRDQLVHEVFQNSDDYSAAKNTFFEEAFKEAKNQQPSSYAKALLKWQKQQFRKKGITAAAQTWKAAQFKATPSQANQKSLYEKTLSQWAKESQFHSKVANQIRNTNLQNQFFNLAAQQTAFQTFQAANPSLADLSAAKAAYIGQTSFRTQFNNWRKQQFMIANPPTSLSPYQVAFNNWKSNPTNLATAFRAHQTYKNSLQIWTAGGKAASEFPQSSVYQTIFTQWKSNQSNLLNGFENGQPSPMQIALNAWEHQQFLTKNDAGQSAYDQAFQTWFRSQKPNLEKLFQTASGTDQSPYLKALERWWKTRFTSKNDQQTSFADQAFQTWLNNNQQTLYHRFHSSSLFQTTYNTWKGVDDDRTADQFRALKQKDPAYKLAFERWVQTFWTTAPAANRPSPFQSALKTWTVKQFAQDPARFKQAFASWLKTNYENSRIYKNNLQKWEDAQFKKSLSKAEQTSYQKAFDNFAAAKYEQSAAFKEAMLAFDTIRFEKSAFYKQAFRRWKVNHSRLSKYEFRKSQGFAAKVKAWKMLRFKRTDEYQAQFTTWKQQTTNLETLFRATSPQKLKSSYTFAFERWVKRRLQAGESVLPSLFTASTGALPSPYQIALNRFTHKTFQATTLLKTLFSKWEVNNFKAKPRYKKTLASWKKQQAASLEKAFLGNANQQSPYQTAYQTWIKKAFTDATKAPATSTAKPWLNWIKTRFEADKTTKPYSYQNGKKRWALQQFKLVRDGISSPYTKALTVYKQTNIKELEPQFRRTKHYRRGWLKRWKQIKNLKKDLQTTKTTQQSLKQLTESTKQKLTTKIAKTTPFYKNIKKVLAQAGTEPANLEQTLYKVVEKLLIQKGFENWILHAKKIADFTNNNHLSNSDRTKNSFYQQLPFLFSTTTSANTKLDQLLKGDALTNRNEYALWSNPSGVWILRTYNQLARLNDGKTYTKVRFQTTSWAKANPPAAGEQFTNVSS